MTKVACVTGSSKGLGREIALALAYQGYSVCVHYYTSKEDANHTLLEIQKKSQKSMLIQADLTDKSQVKNMFSKIYETYGRLDVLVHSVGDFYYKDMDDTQAEDWIRIMENNLYSSLYCIDEALRIMKKQGNGRIIVFGCSGCGNITVREKTTPYYAAKNALLHAVKAHAMYLPSGITINMVSPGILETSTHLIEGVPIVTLAEITNCVRFLLSEEASGINGANIEVSKGWTPENH